MPNTTPIQLEFPHEEAFIDAFILPRSQERCRRLLGSSKRRRDFVNAILSADRRATLCSDVPAGRLTAVLGRILPTFATRKCYIIAEIEDIDKSQRRLSDCLSQEGDIAENMMGSFILSILPGQLAIQWSDQSCSALLCSASSKHQT
jgi:hypothetical protein